MKQRLPWFKCNPGLLISALGGLERDPGYLYVMILLRIYETGGPLVDPIAALARRTGMTTRSAQKALDALIEIGKVQLVEGKIDSDTTHETLAEMEKIQMSAKSGGIASAAKRYGKSQQNQQKGVTTVERPLNGALTTKDIRDKKEKELSKDSSKKAVRRSRIAADTQPNDKQKSDAKKYGMTIPQMRVEWPKFRDHHLGNGSLKVDWDATWRTWCAGWRKFNGMPPIGEVAGEIALADNRIDLGNGMRRTPDQIQSAIKRWESGGRLPQHWESNVYDGMPGQPDCRIPREYLPDKYKPQRGDVSHETNIELFENAGT